MADKCRKVKKMLEPCAGLVAARDGEILKVQALRNLETGAVRNNVVIKTRGKCQPGYVLNYCPFCRADINTEPRDEE